ncbi:conserved hypothetical protein [Leishmania major strain Friedlin]|uniref:Uncharacterized protein n=1 Tax=Leishmania major TaxID=5664 RepID=E9AD73_LEIMA|nr:conserved hypothetical protein [Leishmania major strain Friedlin]CAG9576698.1 hypothetical_protein_-_conserved [Leishmania major strain Friedlin]CBZ12158.1 conserved hypothetical protein [Leishmania major strain Friedlin]|eukprot:XP_003721902.1 conserved hypothetical protein [Leishmania major strain Friedlin]
MHAWRLYLLTSQAVRYLRVYDPVDASMTVAALGELDCRLSVSTTTFFLSLAPSLPHYDSTQLTRVFAGLSRLRVAHYMITAYILKLFLSSLTRDCGSATASTSPVNGGSRPRCAAAEQLAAVAGMVHILQLHHTQRTTRAFLAAEERALAPLMASCGDACSVLGRRGQKDGEACVTSPASARLMAVQVLFLLEVYVNARVRVTAPHTPLWLLNMVFHAPWTSFTLSELLHVYSRLFPGASAHRPAGCAADFSATFLIQELLTENILYRAGGAEREGGTRCRCAPPAAGAEDAAVGVSLRSSDFSVAVQSRCRVWRRRSPGEQYALLRCTVWRLAQHPTERARDAEACELLRFLTPALFCQLSAEFGGRMRGSALRWWMKVLPRSAVERCGVMDSRESDALREGAVGEAVQICIALLQLLYTQHVAAGEEASSSARSAVACHTEDSAGTRQGAGVLVSVQRLVACLRTVASLVPNHMGDEREWELLALLLDVHVPSSCTTTGGTFTHWLETEAHQSGDASHMWRCLSVATEAARDVLMARWCHFWTHHRSANRFGNPMAKSKCRSATLARATEDDGVTHLGKLAEDALLLHWCIANLVNEWLQRSHRASQLCGCPTPPPAHLTSPRFSFQQIWREMLAETVAELDDSHQRVAAGVSPYPFMKLETDLLVIMAESLDPNRTARVRSDDAQPAPLLGSLADAIGQSALPEALCAALEQAQAHSTDAPSRTVPSYAEARVQRERWRRRMWWAASTSAPGTSMSLQAAQVMLLNALFPPSANGCTCASAALVSLRGLSVQWPYRMLAVCLRSSAPLQQPGVTHHAAAEGCGSEWRARIPPWERKDIRDLDAEHHALGSLTPCDSANFTEDPRTPAIDEPSSTQRSLFVCAKGLSNTLMCNIESLVAWQQRCGVLPANTLRGRGEDGRFLPPDLCGAIATPYRMWYRDDTPITLVREPVLAPRPFENPIGGVVASDFAESVPGAASAHGTDVLVPLCETVALLTRAAMPLNASCASLLALPPTRSSPCWTSCTDSAASSSLFTPLSPLRPFAATEALYAELCFRFWECCQRLAEALLPLCAVSRTDSRDYEEVSTSATAAEALAIAGAVEWRLFSRYVSDASPPAEPFCDTYALAAAQGRASALLLPLMWRCVHCCVAGPSPATSRISKCHRPIRGVLLDVWRLHLFATHLCGKLPLPARCERAQERLWWCLQAALSDALPVEQRVSLRDEPSVGSEDQAALELAMCDLKASLRERHWFDSTTETTERPLTFLRDTVISMCDGLGAAPVVSRDGDTAVTSPMDTYVQRLLPSHPFVLAGPTRVRTHLLCGVRLVVLTWMHILLLESIAAYHPRIFSHECTQQLSWVQTRIRAYEQGLYHAILPTAPSCNHGVAHSTGSSTRAASRRRGLLAECLIRELDAAVSELMTWSRGPPCISAP